ncbi:DUF4355 domain-containing protein [Candidatus Enterococcus clewellii]|uniref:Uncharacterized protein n=1 Tax=Candidatus Enterococcus clewellii TaxID=1834193 RepID=A0A242K9X2_9ENTE|nr:DUF4355 domain-containing protein [Enterococcus sp. 9E7_DIV0242]OTP17578.1 hypothetical protein A5888_001716 [Enterococcus sp. 9E7_DIV0242]
MTEEEKKELEELRAQKEQMEAALKEKKYSQAELDAAVAKRVASATADLDAKIKSIQESSMTEQELAKQRQAEETAKTQEYIASLERETRVNFAQSLLATNGLPADQQFAEPYAAFDKETIKLQIEAQAKMISEAKQAEIDRLAKENAPKSKLPINQGGGNPAKPNYVDPRSILESQGFV